MTGPVAAEQLRAVEAADVYSAGRLAGTIVRDGDDTVFSYVADYLVDPAAPQVSFTLPKSASPVRTGAGSVPPFFAGLLPEGARLTATTAATRTSGDDHLTLLLAVGGDTIGDVQVVPIGMAPGDDGSALAEKDIAKTSLSRVFARAISAAPRDLDRVGLPGVQVKVSAQMMSTPLATSSGPAILKLNPPGFPRLVENEACFLSMAAAAGLRVPTHRLVHDRDGQAGLLVGRFDRVVDKAGVHRLAQEDACQLLGRYPAGKYRIKLEDAIAALAMAVAAGNGSGRLAVRQALEIAAFSYLIGNGDLHGKNLSVRRNPDRMWELTPAYDLLTTQPYLSWRDPMAVPLYGRSNKLTRRWWLAAARQLNVPEKALASRLDHIVDVAQSWVDKLADIGFDDKTTERLMTMIRTRGRELTTLR
jgi:serine/threonine-protein kinase HipA